MNEVEKYLEEHLEFVKENYQAGNFICSGRKVPRTGGIILCDFENIEVAKEILNRDPFIITGVATYELIEFAVTMCADEMKNLVEKK